MLLEFELEKLVSAWMNELALLGVLGADADHAEEEKSLRVALPVAKQLDVGEIGEVGKLKALLVFLCLFCDELFELDLAFEGRSTWSSFCLELLQLVIVTCEEILRDEFVHRWQIWQSINFVRKQEDERGQAIDFGAGGAAAHRLGVVELVLAVSDSSQLCGSPRVRVGWTRLFLDGSLRDLLASHLGWRVCVWVSCGRLLRANKVAPSDRKESKVQREK